MLMKRNVLSQLGLGILILGVFLGVFNGLQNHNIYESTLGQFSENYLREGTWENQYISKVADPYRNISNDNLLNWDAAIYSCVSEQMYQPGTDCYGSVRGAFFPLFPIIWRVSHLNARGISVLNYLLFTLSISILIQLFLAVTPLKKNLVFVALITLPSSIIYFIPYSESLFLATMTIAIYGVMQRKYWYYFIGIALMSMVRPATLFILIAMLAMEAHSFLKYQELKRLSQELISKLSPFIIGYALTLIYQYLYSGTWTTYLDAAEFWGGGLKPISSISDWSIEGFGLSIFALSFVVLPSLIYLVRAVLRPSDSRTFSFSHYQSENPRNALCVLSALYLSGIFLFTLLTSGGNLHSFFRFTLCSPFFYVLLLVLIDRTDTALKVKIGFGLSTLLFLLLLFVLEFGGTRFSFSFFGPLLFIAYLAFLSTPIKINTLRIISLLILVGSSIIWNSYLLNILLSNGYIFT